MFLRHRDAGSDHPAGSDPRTDDPSVSAPAIGNGTGNVSASQAQTRSGTYARRAAFSRAGDAHGDRSGGFFAGGSRQIAPRDGTQALARTYAGDLSQTRRGHGRKR